MAKSRKSKKVKSHKKLRYCFKCKKVHSGSEHKFHGKGSYKKSRSKANIKKAKAKARRR